jgi:thiol-disulfide isomerase/thioredoxin
MRKILLSIILLMLVAGIPANVKAVPVQGNGAVVHAALFWTNGCPYCMQALTETLPPIQEKYNSQLSILLVELVSQKDIDNLYSLGSSLGFTKEQVAVPFLLINHTALIGADLIGSQLPGIVDQYISSGGIEYPDFHRIQLKRHTRPTNFYGCKVVRHGVSLGNHDLHGHCLGAGNRIDPARVQWKANP